MCNCHLRGFTRHVGVGKCPRCGGWAWRVSDPDSPALHGDRVGRVSELPVLVEEFFYTKPIVDPNIVNPKIPR
jgi:hypothetical protein